MLIAGVRWHVRRSRRDTPRVCASELCILCALCTSQCITVRAVRIHFRHGDCDAAKRHIWVSRSCGCTQRPARSSCSGPPPRLSTCLDVCGHSMSAWPLPRLVPGPQAARCPSTYGGSVRHERLAAKSARRLHLLLPLLRRHAPLLPVHLRPLLLLLLHH